MFRGQFNFTTCAQEDDGEARQPARKIGKQFTATGVGPLQVVKYNKHRSTFDSHLEKFKNRLPKTLLLLSWGLPGERCCAGQLVIQLRQESGKSRVDERVLI